MKRIVLESDKKLTENELLMYKNGKIISVEIHELLPELKEIKKINELTERVSELEGKVKELRGED